MVEELVARPLSGPTLAIFAIATVLAILLTLNQLLNLQFFVAIVLIESRFLYLLAALLLPLAFLAYAGNKSANAKVPWYDWVLAATSVVVFVWSACQAQRALEAGWEYSAPAMAVAVAAVACIVITEGMRRTSGLLMTLLMVGVGLYPLI